MARTRARRLVKQKCLRRHSCGIVLQTGRSAGPTGRESDKIPVLGYKICENKKYNLQHGTNNNRNSGYNYLLLHHKQSKTRQMKFDVSILAYDEKGNIAQRLELDNLSMIMLVGVLVGFPRRKFASMVITIVTSTGEQEN